MAVVLVSGGCGLFRVPEPPPPSTPEVPQWGVEQLQDHLTVFANRTPALGQPDAAPSTDPARAVGRARSAAYVGARFRESLVQPAFGTSYQQRYEAPPLSLPLGFLRASDSLVLALGRDYLVDARTGVRTMDVSEVLPLRGSADSILLERARGRAVVVQSREVTDDLYRRLASAGASSVFQVGALSPGPARQAAGEMAVFQVTTTAAANILGLPLTALASVFDEPEVRRLRVPVSLEAVRRELPAIDALNVLGYVAGQDPVLQNELVIVCADLDALAGSPGARAAMRSSLGAAVTLELARVYAAFAERTVTPRRTILFAVWSGGTEGYAGLQAYLRQPLWTFAQTKQLVYVGLSEADTPVVQALAATARLPLTIIPLPEAVAERYASSAPSEPSALLTVATSDALALLGQAHRVVLAATNAPRATPPADSLGMASEESR